ncbi:MAG: hypothetical protein QNJ90_15925 [Planctomycetota bacterium]|nr:hypothetical protein [Planctomycetota bacterium]
MSEPAFYIWSSKDGCEACEALRGLYLRPPLRPHPNCRCTITPYYPSSSGEGGAPVCQYDANVLASFEANGEGTDWNEEAQQYDSLQVNVDITVLCKDGSIQEGSYVHVVDVQSDRFPFSGRHDLEAFGESALNDAYRQWELEADRICPDCRDA